MSRVNRALATGSPATPRALSAGPASYRLVTAHGTVGNGRRSVGGWSAMGRWLDGARTGAAFEFGARHHRAFSIVEISLIVARFLLPFAAVAALGFGVWWLFTAIVT